MASPKDPTRPKKHPTGPYSVGYARPPKNGQIKPGEVRNPRGRNGVPKAVAKDVFQEVINREVPVTIGGETIIVTAEHGIWLKHTAAALSGDTKPFRIIAAELRARRASAVPPAQSREEIEAEIELKTRQKALAAEFAAMLDKIAQDKKKAGAGRASEGPSRD